MKTHTDFLISQGIKPGAIIEIWYQSGFQGTRTIYKMSHYFVYSRDQKHSIRSSHNDVKNALKFGTWRVRK